MSGFLDNWKPVDTNKEPSKQTPKAERMIEQTKNLPSTSEVTQPIIVKTYPPESLLENMQSGMATGFEETAGAEYVKEQFGVERVVIEPEKPKDTLKPVSNGEWSYPQSANPAAQAIAIAMSSHFRDEPKVLCGVKGDRKSGKSGIVNDSLTDEEIANGAQIWNLDFDGGGDSTVSAHHKDKGDNILVLNPWATIKNARAKVPFDYPETYNKTMDYLNYALELAQKQDEYFKLHGKMPKPYLKTLVFDGMDHWLHICGTAMKIEDLELGPNAVAVSGRKTATKIGRFNWEFRKNRYQAAMYVFQELARLNVHVYVITGLKPSYDKNGNEIMGADVAAWMKDTERDLEQLIEVRIEKERDANGALTGKEISKAQLVFNRTSLRLPEPVIIYIQESGTDGQWFGYDGLKDGSFESDKDTTIVSDGEVNAD